MRPTLFRTPPILVDGTDVVVLLKDLNGATPVTLYMENLDIHASLNMKWGSKNGNIKFVATDAGALSKDISVEIVEGASFSVDVNTSDPYTVFITITVTGRQTADDVIAEVNADAYTYVVASRASGSDGSAIVNTMSATLLEGDSDAVTLGAVHVYHAPKVDSEAFDESTAAGTAFSSLAAGSVKAFLLDAPVRALKVTATKGSGNTYVVLTGVRGLDA